MSTGDFILRTADGLEYFHRRFESDPPETAIDAALARIGMSRGHMSWWWRCRRERQLQAVLPYELDGTTRQEVAVALFGENAPEVMQYFYMLEEEREGHQSLGSRLKRLWNR